MRTLQRSFSGVNNAGVFNALDIATDAVIGGNLDVGGDLTVSGTFSAIGAINLTGNLAADGLLTVGPPSASFSAILAASIAAVEGVANSIVALTNASGFGLYTVYEDDTGLFAFGVDNVVHSTLDVGTVTDLIAMEGDAFMSGDANVTRMFGVVGYAYKEGAGTVAVMASLLASQTDRAAGTVTLNAGLYVDPQDAAAAALANFGVYNLNANNWHGPPITDFSAGARVWMQADTQPTHQFVAKDGAAFHGMQAFREFTSNAQPLGFSLDATAYSRHAAGNMDFVLGAEGSAVHAGAGTVTYLVGVSGYAHVDAVTGAVAVAAAVHAQADTADPATVAIRAGVYIDPQTAGASEVYGIYNPNFTNYHGAEPATLEAVTLGLFGAYIPNTNTFAVKDARQTLDPNGMYAAVMCISEATVASAWGALGSYTAAVTTHAAGTANGVGVDGEAYHLGAGHADQMAGVVGYCYVDNAAATVAAAASLWAIHNDSITPGAVISIMAGLYIEQQDAGVANYGIYSLATRDRFGGFHEFPEIADPAAPAANMGRFYFRDNGAGKTQFVCRFPTGAVQVVATEP